MIYSKLIPILICVTFFWFNFLLEKIKLNGKIWLASGPNLGTTFVYAGRALAPKFKLIGLRSSLGFAPLHAHAKENLLASSLTHHKMGNSIYTTTSHYNFSIWDILFHYNFPTQWVYFEQQFLIHPLIILGI